MPIEESYAYFADDAHFAHLSKQQRLIAAPILKEIRERLFFLYDVGLGYLTLSRDARTISGGEAQRIRIASQIGSGLTGVMYVLDEPSIGLHERDTLKLIRTLQSLRDKGNTVIVVEHDKETIRAADYIIDIGPGAGAYGGEIVFAGAAEKILKAKTLTAEYLTGRKTIAYPHDRPQNEWLTISGVTINNIRNLSARIPLRNFVCVTGVSGSGKSSLILQTLLPVAREILNHAKKINRIEGVTVEGLEHLDKVIYLDQSPIGRTPRSNPATYTGIMDEIRKLFAQTKEAELRGYKVGRFSFNVKGGRCETCQGDGQIKIEMHFLPDVLVTCDACNGTRYNEQTLEVHYRGKNIAEVLAMSVAEALEFFKAIPTIAAKLKTLHDVGLDYITLGQNATTLSGGEAQRIKLAKELSRKDTGNTLYILDEPTTGLHFSDVDRLTGVLHHLVELGNSVVVIEHNLDMVKNADWVIDMGPEGGNKGGEIIAEGTPETLAATYTQTGSYTGEYLAAELE
jgi:excinuclease ABC subunit A